MSERKSRAQQTEDTRNRVLDRARDLFLSKGFAATSTREMAAAANVTERTLFNIVPTKSELLRQVVLTDVFAGDTGPFLERADFASARQCTSADDFLDRFTGWVTRLHVRTAPLAEVVRAAGSVDAGAAELWAWGQQQQVAGCGEIVKLMHDRGWLRPRLRRTEAADSLAVLSGHDTYWRLATGLHWRPPRYQRWLHRHCSNDLTG